MSTNASRRSASQGLVRLVVLVMLLPVSLVAQANCDGALTPEQVEQRRFCAPHPGCAFVLRIADGCTAVQRWLSQLTGSAGAVPVTDERVRAALAGMRATDLPSLEDAPRISDCLPGGFDRARCRQYIGWDPVPIRVVSAPPPPREVPIGEQMRGRVLELYQQAMGASRNSPGPHLDTRTALADCARARGVSITGLPAPGGPVGDWVAACRLAEQAVQQCTAFKSGWESRRTETLAEIDRLWPGIGREYTQMQVPTDSGTTVTRPIPALRGVGPQRTPDERWNDDVRGLRTIEMPGCPGFVTGTSMTPAEAMARWTAEDRQSELPTRPRSGLADELERAVGEANAREEEKNAAARRAQAERDAADAAAKRAAEDKEREAAAFRDKLQTLTAGQLFALGDELSASGKDAEAREAFRALIARFPESQLATITAQRLSGMAPGAGAAGVGSAPGSGAAGGGAAGSGAAGAGGGLPGIGGAGGSASCSQGIKQLEAEFAAIQRRQPASAGTVELIQLALYQTTKALEFLDRNCQGSPEYAQAATLRELQPQLLQTCRQVAASESYCVPRIPW